MISHVLPMKNPPQTLACKSLNAAGKWASLPRLTVPQRWRRRLSLCNSTSCSAPAKPSLKHSSHDLGMKKKRKTSPLPLSFFICGEIIFSFRNPWEWETERKQEGGREGGRKSEMLLAMPVDYWQLAKSHQKGWGRNRSLCVTWKKRICRALYGCITLLAALLLISSPWASGHSWGINPTVIMLVRVTGSAACVETPVVRWLQFRASGILPGCLHTHRHTHPKQNGVTVVQYMENTHTHTHTGLLPSHQTACLIRTVNSLCSTKGTITEAMIFSL